MVVSHLIHISGFGKLPEPPFFHCLNGVQHSCRDRLPPEFVRDRRMKKRPVPEGCEVLRKGFQVAESGRVAVFSGGRAVRAVLFGGTFGRVLKNVRLSAAAARRLRCRLRCRRHRRCSSHRRLPHCCTLAFVAGGSRLRRSWPDMKKSRRPRRGLRDTFSGLRRIRTCRLRRY